MTGEAIGSTRRSSSIQFQNQKFFSFFLSPNYHILNPSGDVPGPSAPSSPLPLRHWHLRSESSSSSSTSRHRPEEEEEEEDVVPGRPTDRSSKPTHTYMSQYPCVSTRPTTYMRRKKNQRGKYSRLQACRAQMTSVHVYTRGWWRALTGRSIPPERMPARTPINTQFYAMTYSLYTYERISDLCCIVIPLSLALSLSLFVAFAIAFLYVLNVAFVRASASSSLAQLHLHVVVVKLAFSPSLFFLSSSPGFVRDPGGRRWRRRRTR